MLKDHDKMALDNLLENYGNRDLVRALVSAMRSRSHEQSDLGLKEKARESYEWADLLADLLVE